MNTNAVYQEYERWYEECNRTGYYEDEILVFAAVLYEEYLQMTTNWFQEYSTGKETFEEFAKIYYEE